MAKTVVLPPPALAWARSEFLRYYRSTPVAPPSRLARREFAAFPFATETMMRRHAMLRTAEEFRAFLTREAPRHVYYSTAYYRYPDAASMAAKEWLGADLIFDLDSDHLRGAEQLDYAGQLKLVKTRLTDLVDDFLFGDFGIDPRATEFVFSGGRGYHVHIHDERFLPLTSPERRELVDYVLGTGVEGLKILRPRRSDVAAGRTLGGADGEDEGGGSPRGRSPLIRYLAPPDSPGWTGRSTRALLQLLTHWDAIGAEGARTEMVGLGMSAAKARTWSHLLVEMHGGAKIRDSLSLDALSGQQLPTEIVREVVEGAKIGVQGETDAPVTTDIHRLIRLPGSLHGGTGFRVVPLDRDAIAGFDPFRDALLTAPDGRTAPVVFRESVHYPFRPEPISGTPGATDELPTPLALFLVLRGEAELRPSPA